MPSPTVHLVLAAAAGTLLAACEREQPAPPKPAPTSSAPPSGPVAPPAAPLAKPPSKPVVLSPEVKDFQVQLRDITGTSRRVLWTAPDAYARADAGSSITLTLALRDGVGSRIYRFRDGSALASVQDASGRELLKASEGQLRPETSGVRGEFPLALNADRSQLVTQNLRLSVPRLPETIARIKGEYRLELVNQDVEKAIDIPELEKPVEVVPGVTLVLKMLDVPPEGALAGPPSPGAPTPTVRASVEVRSSVAAPDKAGSLVLSVEIVDAVGGVITTLTKREEATVGGTYRRRFSNVGENGYPGGRPDRAATKPPKSIRLRMLTDIEQITVPFEFGPIDLLGEDQ